MLGGGDQKGRIKTGRVHFLHNPAQGSSLYACAMCNKVVTSQKDLASHLSEEHAVSKQQVTDVAAPSEVDSWTVPVGKIARRDGSGRRVDKGFSLGGIRMMEKNTCSVCGKTFGYYQSLVRHKWKCAGTRVFVCETCGYKSYRADHYWLHQKKMHGIERPHKQTNP
ncbi:hypothetical protein BaRGS_00027476 [Batillaria attramentaria]|uniref:C2H2-type domain-containing protein n=1 Tax=Batillaria attramentaria TaxID=370345 RepID=A0ABD0K2V1_9CAEN